MAKRLQRVSRRELSPAHINLATFIRKASIEVGSGFPDGVEVLATCLEIATTTKFRESEHITEIAKAIQFSLELLTKKDNVREDLLSFLREKRDLMRERAEAMAAEEKVEDRSRAAMHWHPHLG